MRIPCYHVSACCPETGCPATRYDHSAANEKRFIFSSSRALRSVVSACLTFFVLTDMTPGLAANEAKYSPEVVQKAEKILEAEGLRQSGKTIQPTNATEISRALTSLARQQRELKLIQQSWKAAQAAVDLNRNQLQQMNTQVGELNLQLARVAGVNVQANNRLVGLIEAARSQIRTAMANRTALQEQLAAERAKLTAAETEYAETVLAIRSDYEKLYHSISESLQKKETQIALRVMATNFETPSELSAAIILKSIDKRLERIEQEIFRESIPLTPGSGGALGVTVVVGSKPMHMIVDSGASLVTLPAKTAVELGIEVPVDARQVMLVMADGRTISARAVVLPRVRIGEFEAENVEAAILDPIATDAEPLLGMSFLQHFKFEIDASEKTITLLRVATD
ncbi:retropepsin-like aspartic protease family protein [Novipirellula caenicola]|uniref:Retroviral aspartyl protease n=1 Tax=Novipirellula caenicola TaxID=1536901 RepID=A0ABP9VNL1_9BACT